MEAFGKKGSGEGKMTAGGSIRWLTDWSDSARRDRDERTPEENAKLDKVLEDLSELAKKDAGERSDEEIRAKFDSLFEILEIWTEPTVPKEDVQKLKGGCWVQHLLGHQGGGARPRDIRRGDVDPG